MRKFFLVGAAVAALGAGGLVIAGDDAQQKLDPNEVICQPGKPPIGSRINGPSECHTRAQWDQMSHDARLELERQQTHVTAPSSGG